jgi:hypothetical protein
MPGEAHGYCGKALLSTKKAGQSGFFIGITALLHAVAVLMRAGVDFDLVADFHKRGHGDFKAGGL